MASEAAFIERSQEFNFKSFQVAKDSPSFLRFDINSSLIGFLTAHFSGFSKKFILTWKGSDSSVKDLKITVPIASLDTNMTSRTLKMHDYCFEYKDYPQLTVQIDSELILEEGVQRVKALATVRGKTTSFMLDLSLLKQDRSWQVFGEHLTTLTALNIKNPTIAKGIASFDDDVKIYFNFEISENT